MKLILLLNSQIKKHTIFTFETIDYLNKSIETLLFPIGTINDSN